MAIIDLSKVKIEHVRNNRFEVINSDLRVYIDAVFYKDENSELKNYWNTGVLESGMGSDDIIYKELCFDDFDEAYKHYLGLIEEELKWQSIKNY